MSNLLVPFVFELRRRNLRVGPMELDALASALEKKLHQSTLSGFYYTARALLTHSETELDAFDEAFAAQFKGVDHDAHVVLKDIEAWLRDPAMRRALSDEERRRLSSLDMEAVRKMFLERLAEQKKRHSGGSRWIGTGGTSPFGAGGYHPSGIRVGPMGGGRSALGVADARSFAPYRKDLVFNIRQIEVALRKLRNYVREGLVEELDIDATIDATARDGGELHVVTRPPRRSDVRMILMMDVGGSMDPHIEAISELFSAANRASHFRELKTYYFHNAIYGQIYKSESLREPVPISEIFRKYEGRRYHLVMVGDAAMHPFELHSDGPWYQAHANTEDRRTALHWFYLLADHFKRNAWLNPDPHAYWRGTVLEIRRVFPMFELTLDGLSEAMASLSRAAHHHHV